MPQTDHIATGRTLEREAGHGRKAARAFVHTVQADAFDAEPVAVLEYLPSHRVAKLPVSRAAELFPAH